MLSLVSYGSSNESDNENDSENEDGTKSSDSEKIFSSNINDIKKSNSSISENEYENVINQRENCKKETDHETVGKLSSLPNPINHIQNITWEQLSKLSYKSRAVQIMAPLLPPEEDEQGESNKKKCVPSKGGSGLLSLLPKPKHEFMPQPKSVIPLNRPSFKNSKLLKQPKKIKEVNKVESDSDGEDSSAGDFFSLSSSDSEIKDVEPAIDYEVKKVNVIPESPLAPPIEEHQDVEEIALPNHAFIPTPEPEVLELDETALKELCGSRGLKRRANELRMIDIDGASLAPDAKELLTKNLTQDLPRPSKSFKFGPSSQQKRKHQITYLAHHAKEQELELKNMWANNRMTRKQTQAKYGF